jgi:hypothetical protein
LVFSKFYKIGAYFKADADNLQVTVEERTEREKKDEEDLGCGCKHGPWTDT